MEAQTKTVTEAALRKRRDKKTALALAAFDEANDAFDSGDYPTAAEAYAQACKAVPGFIDAIYNRATALLLSDHFHGALAGFLETLKLDPEHAAACNNGAVAASRAGDHARAAELERRALELDPSLASPDDAADPLANAYQLLASIEDEKDDDQDDADLVLAAYFGDVPRAKRALDGGASPDAKQRGTGMSALMLAVANDHAPMVRLLLERGADANSEVTATLDNGESFTVTVLERADAEGKDKIAQLLRKHGAR